MNAKDLSQEPPHSPHYRIHDYVILGRTLDKCRASLSGTAGEYKFDSYLDNLLFNFKGISAADFIRIVESGADDEEVGQWLDENGNVKTAGDISDWSKSLDYYLPFQNQERRGAFIEKCQALNLNPSSTTLFAYLEADDHMSFPDFIQVSPDTKNWDLPMVETAPGDKTPSSLKAAFHQG